MRSAPNPQGAEGEPERLLLLQTLFAAKQHALRRYQLYNREFVEITPDQLYWQTQKEDATPRSYRGACRPARGAGRGDGRAAASPGAVGR